MVWNIWIPRVLQGRGSNNPNTGPQRDHSSFATNRITGAFAYIDAGYPRRPGDKWVSSFRVRTGFARGFARNENFAHIRPSVCREKVARRQNACSDSKILWPKNVLLWPSKDVKERLSWDPSLLIQTSFVPDQMPRKFKATQSLSFPRWKKASRLLNTQNAHLTPKSSLPFSPLFDAPFFSRYSVHCQHYRGINNHRH